MSAFTSVSYDTSVATCLKREEEPHFSFVKPIIGFEEFQDFFLQDIAYKNIPFPVKKLSHKDSEVSFLVTERFNGIYHPQDLEKSTKELGLDVESLDILTFVILSVVDNTLEISLNLKAPLLIKRETKQAYQVVLEGDFYPLELKL
jgi:flagellar assembly factor FliW